MLRANDDIILISNEVLILISVVLVPKKTLKLIGMIDAMLGKGVYLTGDGEVIAHDECIPHTNIQTFIRQMALPYRTIIVFLQI
jgi:hypothetical protein